jgi:hypothetical protein
MGFEHTSKPLTAVQSWEAIDKICSKNNTNDAITIQSAYIPNTYYAKGEANQINRLF